MGKLFGIALETDFDPGVEERRDRLWWPFLVGTCVCIICALILGRPFGTRLFQLWIFTSLFYGETFYVLQGNNLARLWLWKVIFISIPLHLALSLGILIGDQEFPGIMLKAFGFLPIILLGLLLESVLAQKLISLFARKFDQSSPTAKEL